MKCAAICIPLLISLVLSCGDDAVEPRPAPEPPATPFDAQVWENAHAVAAAADSFYLANGDYPRDVGELLPFLPGDALLVNPATGDTTEPVMPDGRTVLLDPPLLGSVGMRVFRRYEGNMTDVGYYIVGRGQDCDTVVTNVPESELLLDRDAAVVENCRLVAEAAHAFARDNGGRFATNGSDVNGAGKRLQDYLPGGTLQTNPYTEANTEPQWGAAAAGPGQTGYIAVDPDNDGDNEGYVADGLGSAAGAPLIQLEYPPQPDGIPPPEVAVVRCPQRRDPPPASSFDLIVAENCIAVEKAAQEFYVDRGAYAISNLALLTYLPDGWWLLNPATLVRSEPSGQIPMFPGSVGYRRIGEYNVGVIGYLIEGNGEERVFRRTNVADVERHLALEQEVVAVCHVVEAAAESFAADNLGWVPYGQYDVSLKGRYFQEYLPGGELLLNPYTGERTEPRWGQPVSLPGQVVYAGFDTNRDGTTERYAIQGIGALEQTTVYSATWWSRPQTDIRTEDEIVRDNCAIVAGAARAHHAVTGQYPVDPAALRSFLPDGDLLFNPFTFRRSEPSGPIPDVPGSIGYRLIWEYLSQPVGYYIQGRGGQQYLEVTNVPDVGRHLAIEAKVILNCVTVGDAAEAFARDNTGVFPRDESDVNLLGKRVGEYLPGGMALENPYTKGQTVPLWSGAAAAAGQTGYAAWHEDADGVPDGYTVNGVGAASGVNIFVILDPERRWQPPANPTPIRVYGPQ